ncbi:MAG: Rieske (2Fe-2S) protein [Chloroflexota bacterium]|nr:MAG: nitrite reductase [Chloroflexota bacterium]
MTTSVKETFVRAARLEEVRQRGCMAVQVGGQTVALFASGDQVFAVDNRCPHMGFPLDRGTVRDGVLVCHWHHARFDLATGGTFDPWADDVRTFPVEIRGDEVWVDVSPPQDSVSYYRQRLRDGLERNISLVLAKSAIALVEEGVPVRESFATAVDYGVRFRRSGWGQGLTILTCMMNLMPSLRPEDRARALYHGLSAVASDTDGEAPRFILRPLPGDAPDVATLTRWFRQFIEVRDSEGAERCIVSAIRAGASMEQLADMLFAAATDHRYIDVGHRLDFTNKAFEALDIIGWEHAEAVLSSLASGYAGAARMEEANEWRYPVDLVELLDNAFDRLEAALEEGRGRRGQWQGQAALTPVLLGDDPAAIVDALLEALRQGCEETALAGRVAYAAALRIARFHTSNDFGDWDTALHTFTFANAVHQGLRRSPSTTLLRGVFDAAMSVYLDRFLNIPAARIPQPTGNGGTPEDLRALDALLDRQQQVNSAGELVARYLYAGGDVGELKAALGSLLLRENRDFHTIQAVEAAFRQSELLEDEQERAHVLIAAARYLAAHAPTSRSQGQVFNIAQRLARGERLFEGD